MPGKACEATSALRGWDEPYKCSLLSILGIPSRDPEDAYRFADCKGAPGSPFGGNQVSDRPTWTP